MLGQWHPPPTPSNQRLNRALRVYAPLSSHQYQKTARKKNRNSERDDPSLFPQHQGRVPQHHVPQQPSRCSLMRAHSTPSLFPLREPHPQLILAVGRCRALTHGAISHGCRQPWAGAGPLPTAIFLMTPDRRGQVQGPYPRRHLQWLQTAVGRCRALTHGDISRNCR